MKVIQISDTHISHLGGITSESARRMIEVINELEPDFVVHSGDVTILDPDEDRDRVAAKEILAAITAPVRVLPGNHDVGEPGEKPFGDAPVTSERVAAFRAHFGEDRFVEDLGDILVIGLNSELFESGLPEEAEQWEWIESLPEQLSGRPALFFSHKPVWAPRPEFQDPRLAIGSASLTRLEAVLEKLNVRAFGSGHLHHYVAEERGGVPVVSAPSTAFVHQGGGLSEIFGNSLSQLGVVEYLIEGEHVRPFFRAPFALAEPDFLEVPEARAALDAMGVVLAAATA